MKGKIVVFLPVILSVTALFADDGSWSKSFSVDGGAVYAQTDHPDIVLEKELLIFNGAETAAVFLFRNDSDRPVTVECGFPVLCEIEAWREGDHLEIPVGKYGSGDIPALEYFETEQLEDDDEYGPSFVYPRVILLNAYNNGREFVDYFPGMSGIIFNIEQDGESVPVEAVLVERQAGNDGAALTFHFKHSLVFSPNAQSTVRVEYTQDLLYGDPGMMEGLFDYRWKYVIGTGGTWKGPIGELYVLKPKLWNGSLDALTPVYADDAVELYQALSYEPEIDTRFELQYLSGDMMERMVWLDETLPVWKKMWRETSKTLAPPDEPVQGFVTDVKASSALADRLRVYTADGVMESAGFGPEAAFDGYAETAWCENGKGYGHGQYLEIRLTRPVWGLGVRNGFKRFAADDWVFGYYAFDRMVRDDAAGLKDYFPMNGRVKVLSIRDASDRTVYSLELADIRDLQYFAGVNLAAGRYRFVIEETYPGSHWEDTCLSEITFLPADVGIALVRFLSDPFCAQALETVRFAPHSWK